LFTDNSASEGRIIFAFPPNGFLFLLRHITERMSLESYQPVAQKPEEERFLEGEREDDPIIAISALRSGYQRQQRLIVAQWILSGVLLVAIFGVFWKGRQPVQAGCPYPSVDGPLPAHVFCTPSF
jgi:hypothetical protein